MSEQVQMEMAGVLPTADGEGLCLLAPCYVARQERVAQCMGSLEIGMQRFAQAILSAQLLKDKPHLQAKYPLLKPGADSTPFGHSAHADPDTCSTAIRTGSRSAATQGVHC